MRRQIIFTLVVVFSFIFQFAFSGYLAVYGIFPNFILSAVLCISLIEQPSVSMVAGFIGGLFVDVISGGIIGLSAFTQTISCYIVSISSNERMIHSRLKSAALIYVVGVMNYSLMFMMLFLFGMVNDYSYFLRITGIGPIYNLFISVLILELIRTVLVSRDNYGEFEKVGSFWRKI